MQTDATQPHPDGQPEIQTHQHSDPQKIEDQEKKNLMSATANLVDESFDRVQSAWKSMETEFQKVQKRLEDRGSQINDRAEKEFEKFRDDLRSYPGVQQVEALGEELKSQIAEQFGWFSKQFESNLETILSGLQIASRSEIEKLDRKLNRISKRLSALDKAIQEKAKTT